MQGTNVLIFALIINILALTFSSFLQVNTLGDILVYKVFTKTDYDQGTISGVNPAFDTIDKSTTPSASSNIFGYVLDSLIDWATRIVSWIFTIFGLGVALYFLLIQTGTPIIIANLIGLPIAFLFYMSIISFIKGVQF